MKLTVKDERRVFELANTVAEGIATENDIQELEGFLKESSEAREVYLQVMDLDADLDRLSLVGGLNPESSSNGCELILSDLDMDLEKEKPLQSKNRGFRVLYPSFAAVACLTLTFIMLSTNFLKAQPNYQAIIIDGQGDINGKSFDIGGKLNFEDIIQLSESQKIKLKFTDETVVELDGPTSLVLNKYEEEGRQFQLAGSQAQDSFMLSAAKTRIEVRNNDVDRKLKVIESDNTFGVKTGKDFTEVHVFEGRVTSSSQKAIGETQVINQLQAAKFTKKGLLKSWVKPNPEEFDFKRQYKGVSWTNNNIHFSTKIPSSLKAGDYESNSGISLIPEKKGVYLSKDLNVTFLQELSTSGGTRSAYKNHWKILKKGVKVDSYLLHFDPATSKYLDGEIYFDKPILALICNGNQLVESDALFALDNVQYPAQHKRGLDSANPDKSELDVLKFYKDPTKVGARFASKNDTVDQVRILILSE